MIESIRFINKLS